MAQTISLAEAKTRVGTPNDSATIKVSELQAFISATDADNIRIYSYKSDPNGRTNFIISAYTRGVEKNQIFLGDDESITNPIIVIEETETVLD